VDAILALPAFQEWRSAAMTEAWIVEADEVDEEAIENYRKAA
jgi:glutathione S-transferase